MINLKKTAPLHVIYGHSDIAGGMRPTAHGSFPTFGAANAHARANMKETKFEIFTEQEAARIEAARNGGK